MLYLITGANGAGKTLNTLKWVRERQLKENRPVYHNGRFEPVEGGELSSWKTIDVKDWQSLEDGAIILVDECHNDFPVRPSSEKPPEYVRMLAEHRRRGFDFYLVTQHPQNIDSFVRRLIGAPGWHRHLKRVFGADMVSSLEWAAVNPNCEKDGSGKNAEISTIRFPKEVYGWYRSASLHTGKKKIPKAVFVLLACALAVPALGYLGYRQISGVKRADAIEKSAVPAQAQAANVLAGIGPRERQKLTQKEYVEELVPRLAGYPHTAPRYDDVTRPTVAPYPAACIKNKDRCECYTQQATLMLIDPSICRIIVQRGYFVDWQQPQPQVVQQPKPEEPIHAPQVQPRPMLVAEQVDPGQQYLQGLAARNAEVRSVITK